jgi:hypothetical protein
MVGSLLLPVFSFFIFLHIAKFVIFYIFIREGEEDFCTKTCQKQVFGVVEWDILQLQ